MKKIKEVKNENGSIRRRVVTVNDLPSMTDQSYKEATDAKNVVKTFLKTGLVTHINKSASYFADVSDIEDLYESMSKVKAVEKYFMELPAELRKKLDNDPRKLLEVIVDPEKQQLQEELGLEITEKIEDPIEKPLKKETKSDKDTGSNKVPS